MYTYEIYLTNKYVTKEKWLKFIQVISNYAGILKKWQITLVNNQNKLQYFLKINRQMPPTINGLDSFVLKTTTALTEPKRSLAYPIIHPIGSSVIDLINYNEIKDKGNLIFLNIKFLKLYEDKIISNTTYYVNKNEQIKKYHVILGIPASILAINFESNQRYFYKSIPKYLDISKILSFLNSKEDDALLKVQTFPYLSSDKYLNTADFNFAKHSLILGASGSGKSKFISKLVYNITQTNPTKKNYRIVLIDPHADLVNDIGGLGKIIDFDNESLNLFAENTSDALSQTELLLDLFKNLISNQYNSKLERVLRHAINVLLIYQKFSFTNLKKLILDIEFRNKLIKDLKGNVSSSTINFFLSDFNELKTKSYTEAISPIISFIDEMEMLPTLSDTNNSSLENTIDNNYLTIFSLDQTKLGTKITNVVSGLIMNQMLTLIRKKSIKEPIIFIIDEVATIENSILTRFLSEARKYNLSLFLATQYFNQLSPSLKNAIFANTSNYYIFRTSRQDATTIVDNLNIKIPLDDSKEKKIELLSNLNNRECVVRIERDNTLLPTFKATTINYQSIPSIKKNKNSFVAKNISKNKSQDFTFNINTKIKPQDLIIPDESE